MGLQFPFPFAINTRQKLMSYAFQVSSTSWRHVINLFGEGFKYSDELKRAAFELGRHE